MSNRPEVIVYWFRRDLRLNDNHGLFQALKKGIPVLPIFIFDRNILDNLDKPHDLRVQFIHNALTNINLQLKSVDSGLTVYYSTPEKVFLKISDDFSISEVVTNHDYEPYAIERDLRIKAILGEKGISFNTYKDHVVFEKSEVVKDDGKPYTIFTPYSRKWKSRLFQYPLTSYSSEKYISSFFKYQSAEIISLESMGFTSQQFQFPSTDFSKSIIQQYSEHRNFPAIEGTSKLGVHLRFGTISIRELAFYSGGKSEVFLNELIWRDFYQMILWNFPHVGKGFSFKKEYDQIEWRNNASEFEKWCEGQTGYPIVDAGMRELLNTGFMHNRVRMITASFLTKHLLVDWRWGESWFAKYLLDFDLASNNGGWQWAAGSGCDAAPYFRVFNPTLQTEKFDKAGAYIRKWVPEIDSLEYTAPIVVHDFARKRCLEVYAKTLKKTD